MHNFILTDYKVQIQQGVGCRKPAYMKFFATYATSAIAATNMKTTAN